MTMYNVIWKSIAGSLLIFCLMLFSASDSLAQEFGLIVSGTLTSQNDRSKLEGAKIIVKRNGSSFETTTADAKGKFTVRLPQDATYVIECTFTGYVTKRLAFNLKNIPPDYAADGDEPFNFDMALFKEMEGLDVSILNKPMATLALNDDGTLFEYNKEYTKSVQAQIEKMQEDIEQLEKDYSKAMSDGAKAMSNQDYAIAKTHFAAALSIKKGDEDAMKELDKAREKHEKLLAEKSTEKAYTEAIEAAEIALLDKEYKTAEGEFEKALDAKPGDIYARDQLKEIRDIMVAEARAEQTYITAIGKADAALAVSDYLTAKAEYTKAAEAKPADKYATSQLAHVEDLLVADAQKESDYIKAIERGESSFEAKDYEGAKAAFETASQIKPEEKFPKNEIAKITAILADIELKRKSYDDAIKRADDALAINEFEKARTSYEEAIDINPEQQYPKDQIAAINSKMEEIAKLEAQYDELIADADKRFEAKDMVSAKAEYTKALGIKPGEEHPKARIDEITTILEREAKLEEEYKSAISNADGAYKAKDYNSAKFEYEAASKLKPDEEYPKTQLAAIATFLADQAKQEEDYKAALAEGDAAMDGKDYEGAKGAYTKAAGIKPEEEYPKIQLKAIESALIELANLNKSYDDAIANADKQYDAGDLAGAKVFYETALEFKPQEAYPKEKIAAIVTALADAQKKEEDYQAFIAKGDKSFDEKKFEAAKESYVSAKAIKPEEKYPMEKIAEIDGMIAAMAATQKEYDDAIAKADQAFNNNELEASLPLYKEAAGIKEGESYPISQITLIEAKLEDQKKLEESYAAAIAAGESAEKSGDLSVALTEFKAASELKPEEAYPKEKITALNTQIANNEKIEADYLAAIKLADQAKAGKEYDIALAQYQKASEAKPDEQYPKDQLKEVGELKLAALAAIELAKKQDENYKALITEADGLFDGLQYEEAKKKYQAALDVKPTEEYPKTKIGEADAKLASLMAEQEKNEKYSAAISAGDKAFSGKDWENARSSYQEAKAIKPEESYPGDQITKIDAAITEAAALASQKEKDEQYAQLIATADADFKSESWEKAKSNYSQAKIIKPEESYPDDQIKAIDAAIASAAALAAQNAAEAEKKAIEEKYAGLIASADQAFKAEDWDGAKADYQSAKVVKPQETYPEEQLKAIDKAIAAAAALAAQNAAQEEIEARNARYNELIAKADDNFESENWEAAKSTYQEAKSVKPEETYPDQQLKAIDQAIAAAAALAASSAAAEQAKQRDEQYAALISTADNAFKSDDWDAARENYLQAKKVKSSETYPDEQIIAIDAAIAKANALASQQAKEAQAREREEKYNALVAAGDKAFQSKSYSDAKLNYEEALTVKPEETYPKDQLKAIGEAMMADKENAKKENYDAYVSTADRAFKVKDWNSAKSNYKSASDLMPTEQYPKDQLKRIEEAEAKEASIALNSKQEESYRQAIGDADQLFNNQDWQASKSKYQEALTYKPEEVYPKNKIIEINEKIALAEESGKVDKEYNKVIALADASFAKEDYESARTSYNQALKIKNESYPKERLEAIDQILNAEKTAMNAEKAKAEQREKEYNKFILAGDNSFSAKDYPKAKNHYETALNIKPNEKYPAGKLKELEGLMKKTPVAAAPLPKKKSSGMSEAEIAAMMAAWQADRNQAKVDRMNQQKADLQATADERNNNAEEKRTETNNDLNDLENTLAESNKAGANRNLEEAMLIEETRSDQQKFQENLNKDAEANRNDLYQDIEETEMGQKEMKEEGNELYLVNTEKKTTEKIELINAQKERSEDAHNGLVVAHEDIVELEDDIRKGKDDNKDRYMNDVERIQKENALVASTVQTWSDESREARYDSYDAIRKQENEIIEFQANNAESYMANTETYNKDTKELSEYRNKKNIEATKTRTKAYNEITDYNDEVAEITQEKHNQYDENNERIRKENEALIDQEAQLAANADERRMKFDRNFYTGEEKPRYPELAREYNQGVTEESYEEDDAYVVKRIVVKGENIDEYKKIFYKWGAVYYKKNDEQITETIWNTETQ